MTHDTMPPTEHHNSLPADAASLAQVDAPGDDPAAPGLRDELARMAATATAGALPSPADARAAAERARRMVRAWAATPAVAGSIRPGDADGSSRLGRWVKWPLAAAASLVAGLVLITLVADGPRSASVTSIASETSGLQTPWMAPGGRTGGNFGFGVRRLLSAPDDASFDASLAGTLDRFDTLFATPGMAEVAAASDASWEELAAYDLYAALSTPASLRRAVAATGDLPPDEDWLDLQNGDL